MQTIGERLEEARKRKGVTIREAAEATKIRGDYLNSFENNNFDINVPEIYVRGFLRSYCNFLKVNSEKLVTDYNASLLGEAKTSKREHREFFGRMELQQPLVQEQGSKAGTIDDTKPEPEEKEAKPGILDRLQNIEKEVAIKIGIIAVIALIVVVLIIWGISLAIGSGSDTEAPSKQPSSQMVPTNSQPVAASETIKLVAVGDVRVSVKELDSGRILVDNLPMAAGAETAVTKTGPIRIDYSAGENLQVEISGERYGTGKTGPSSSKIP